MGNYAARSLAQLLASLELLPNIPPTRRLLLNKTFSSDTNRAQTEAREKTFYFGKAQPILCKDGASQSQRKLVYFGEAQPILCKGNIFPATNYSFSAKIHKTFAYSIYVNAIRSTLILSLLPAFSKNRP